MFNILQFMRTIKYLNKYNILGPEKKTKIPDDDANKITAYHEGGHAIVAYFTKDSHPLHKVTIMPRGSSLGHVRMRFVII